MFRKLCILFIGLFLSISLLPTRVFANSAEPPSFTVLVINPSDDLSLTLHFGEEFQKESIELRKNTKAWEGYYRFFHSHEWEENYENAYLFVKDGEEQFQIAIPYETFTYYNNLLTLDVKEQTLTLGQPIWRNPLLVSIRVISTLIIEAIVFAMFRYKDKRSWMIFLVTNLITQGILNIMIVDTNLWGSYPHMTYTFGEWIVLFIEMIVYFFALKEHKRGKGIIYAICANLLSLLIGGALISRLPV